MFIQNFGNTKSDTTVRSTITASLIPPLTPQIAANPSRQKICFSNGAAVFKFYIAFGSTIVSPSNFTVVLNPGDYFEELSSIDSVSVIANGTSLTDYLFITEMS